MKLSDPNGNAYTENLNGILDIAEANGHNSTHTDDHVTIKFTPG